MNYTVYKHTSPSGKVYIGITSQKPKGRWANGRGYNHNEYFQNAIKKYGWENFKHEILYTNLTKEEAEQKEIELIKFYDSTNRDKGYNISAGGSCSAASEETKKKISKALRAKAKNINQFDLQGNFIKVWESSCEVQRILNIDQSSIIKCCKNKINHAGGYVWRYAS